MGCSCCQCWIARSCLWFPLTFPRIDGTFVPVCLFIQVVVSAAVVVLYLFRPLFSFYHMWLLQSVSQVAYCCNGHPYLHFPPVSPMFTQTHCVASSRVSRYVLWPKKCIAQSVMVAVTALEYIWEHVTSLSMWSWCVLQRSPPHPPKKWYINFPLDPVSPGSVYPW